MAQVQGVSCRRCWQSQPADAHRLGCGDVFCADCLASLARAALQLPKDLLPLRCCQQLVSAELIAAALKPEELAFYRFLTAQDAAAKRERVTKDNQALLTKCDFCSGETSLVTAKDAQELLLDCGHVYCQACLASMREANSAKSRGAVVCCQALVGAASNSTRGKAIGVAGASKTVKTAAAKTGRRVSLRLKDGGVVFTGETQAELLSDQPQEPQQSQCTACNAAVDAGAARVAAPCGHIFCFACVKQQCQRALKNETQGSIGFPIRCCEKLLPLDAIQPALSKREFLKYEALVATRGDAVPMKLRNNKRKADAVEPPATETQAKSKRPRGRPSRAKANVKAEPEPQPEPEPVKQEYCVACMERFNAATEVLRGPCSHTYCVTCVGMMARESLTDRARVPIRCCSQEFPIDYVKRVLPKTKMAQYERFLKEMDWRSSNLKSDKEYARVVKKMRGKQCPTCGIGVEKIGGCDAMRCLRGHYFCWKCEAAPCKCGRTQLQQYGWVAPPAAAAAAAAPVPAAAAGKS